MTDFELIVTEFCIPTCSKFVCDELYDWDIDEDDESWCRSLEQMLPNVTRTMASVGSMIVGLGLSIKANSPLFIYVYAFICFSDIYAKVQINFHLFYIFCFRLLFH